MDTKQFMNITDFYPISLMKRFNQQQFPWGSILRSVLFNTFINDLDAGVECILYKGFQVDNKLRGSIDSLEGQVALLRDLDRLELWVYRKIMKYNKRNARCHTWDGLMTE